MRKEDIELMDKEQLSDKETLFAVFGEQDEFERQVLINAMVERAKDLKCTRQIQGLIRAFSTQMKKAMRSDPEGALTDFGYPYADEMKCGNWVANESGVSIRTMLGDMVACYHPIMPVERLRNIETKTEKVRIAFKRNGRWEDGIIVDKEIIASAAKIVGLSKYGISVTSENAKWLVRFLADLENFNDIPVRSSTSKFGWIGTKFIPYDDAATFDSSHRFRDFTNAISECGSFETWKKVVLDVRSNKTHFEPQLVMSAAFASVLLKPLTLSPFVFNLSGRTGNGKTVALMLATSIYANPGEHKYLVEVESTQNAFEVRLDILNNFPLMIDDFSKIEDKFKDRFTDLIYMLTSGRGKDRATIDLGLNASKTWCNITIGAMERPLTNDTMRGGAINRVLDFAAADGAIFRNPNRIVEQIRENYGFAGKLFIETLRDIGWEQIAEKRKEYEQAIRDEAQKQNSVKEDKQILPLSAILTADWIATEHIFHDGIYLDLGALVTHLADIDEISEYSRGYDYIVNYVSSHPNEFEPNEDNEYKGRAGGFIKDGFVYINPNVFREIAKEGNFSVQAFCREAKTKGMLKTNSHMRIKVRMGGKTSNYYAVKLPDDDWVDEIIGAPGEGIIDLPFD